MTLTATVLPTGTGPVEVAVVGADDGPAVLVLHGMPGDFRQARALAADLAATHRVVLISRPGYGRTPLRVGRTPAAQAAAASAVLAELGIDSAVVVGISGGGPSAFAFATADASQCTGLVLCCALAGHLMTLPRAMRLLAAPPLLWPALASVGRVQARRQLRDADAVVAELGRELTDREQEMLRTDERMRADLLAFAADRADSLRGVGLRNDARQIVAATRGGAPVWPNGRLVPTVVLHGADDTVVPVEHAEFYAGLIPDAELRVFPGLSHPVPLTARDELAAAVTSLAARAG